MNINTIFLVAGVLCLLIYFFIRNKKNKLKLILPVLGILFLIVPSFLPYIFLGNWDSINELENKEIKNIILEPSQPKWEVNLVDSTVKIDDRNRIGHLLNLLHNTEVYSPSHPKRIWEVKLIFVTVDNDSIPIKIEKVDKKGAVVYSKRGYFKKEGLAEYLEEAVNFYKPVKGK